MKSAALSPDKIGQIFLNVHDLPRAVAFYRNVIGLKHLFDAEPKMSFFDCGGTRIMGEANCASAGPPARVGPAFT